MQLTSEQITALAPDPASLRAGQALAAPGKWQNLGQTESAAWGEISGSGKNPYQVIIDFTAPAFKCTCPSRKFPCKHGLALALILSGGALAAAEPPDWVATWLQSREERARKKSEGGTSAVPVDAAKAEQRSAERDKRTAARQQNMAAGVADLQLWLNDLMRQGLAARQDGLHRGIDTMALRLVDAQAPGLARLVRNLAAFPHSGDHWQERLLEGIGRIHLLTVAFGRMETLPTEHQADIRALIGLPQSRETLLEQEGVLDTWLVLGRRVVSEDNLRLQRTWLYGERTGRSALLLDYAAGQQPLATVLEAGLRLDAELVFYPGGWPVRALLKTQHGLPTDGGGNPFGSILAMHDAYAADLIRCPWIENYPMPLDRVVPVPEDGWMIQDAAGYILPLARNFTPAWQLAALSGGEPLRLFGEWDGAHLWPLSVFSPAGKLLMAWAGAPCGGAVL